MPPVGDVGKEPFEYPGTADRTSVKEIVVIYRALVVPIPHEMRNMLSMSCRLILASVRNCYGPPPVAVQFKEEYVDHTSCATVWSSVPSAQQEQPQSG